MKNQNYQNIIVQELFDGSVCQIILNRPKANVLDSSMMSEMSDCFKQLSTNTNCKLIILEGSGDHFSYGASVAEHTKEKAPKMLGDLHNLFRQIAGLEIPLLSKVRGLCLGGAFELIILSNFIFTDETAIFGLPEIQLGVIPPLASVLLGMKIGQTLSEEMILTGKRISAQEIKTMGLLNYVVKDKTILDQFTEQWIKEKILPLSASSLRYGYKSTRNIFSSLLMEQLDKVEKIYLNELMETHDANEGINSFLEKRKPIWRNS